MEVKAFAFLFLIITDIILITDIRTELRVEYSFIFTKGNKIEVITLRTLILSMPIIY